MRCEVIIELIRIGNWLRWDGRVIEILNHFKSESDGFLPGAIFAIVDAIFP